MTATVAAAPDQLGSDQRVGDWPIPGAPPGLLFASADFGDFSGANLTAALGGLGVDPGNVTWLHQVHGAEVVTVTSPGQHCSARADAAVTSEPGAVLAVRTADCVPVVFWSPDGVVGVAHAGWRGLLAGVVEACVAAMRALGAVDVQGAVGPCIHACCYAFGRAELEAMQGRFGPEVVGVSADGRPALDLVAATQAALSGSGGRPAWVSPDCTACSPRRYYSHRARAEAGRQVSLVHL